MLNCDLILKFKAFKKKSKMNRIKEVMSEKGIKQIWLAEQIGKSYNIVNEYCNNRRQPSLEMLFQIARLLNVEVKDLIKQNY